MVLGPLLLQKNRAYLLKEVKYLNSELSSLKKRFELIVEWIESQNFDLIPGDIQEAIWGNANFPVESNLIGYWDPTEVIESDFGDTGGCQNDILPTEQNSTSAPCNFESPFVKVENIAVMSAKELSNLLNQNELNKDVLGNLQEKLSQKSITLSTAFVCEMCNKSFKKKINLIQHKMVHCNRKIQRLRTRKQTLKPFRREEDDTAELENNVPESSYDEDNFTNNSYDADDAYNVDNSTFPSFGAGYALEDEDVDIKNEPIDDSKPLLHGTDEEDPLSLTSPNRKGEIKIVPLSKISQGEYFPHLKVKPFGCSYCNYKFYSSFVRDAHVKRKHEGVLLPYECDECKKVFNRPIHLLNHYEKFHSENTEEIEKLKILIPPAPNVPSSKTHSSKLVNKGRKYTTEQCKMIIEKSDSLKCPICKRKFTDVICRNGHIRRRHEGLKKPYVCDCGVSFQRPLLLQMHISRKHEESGESGLSEVPLGNINENDIKHVIEDAANFRCPICKRNFDNILLRNAHIKRKHQGINNPYICECGKSFQRPSTLRFHIINAHKDLQKSYVCECGMSFQSPLLLQMHMSRKHDEPGESRPAPAVNASINENEIQKFIEDTTTLRCPICKRNFDDILLRNAHIKRKHQGINRPYTCDCGKSFQRPSTLRLHIINTHNEEDKTATLSMHFVPQREPNKKRFSAKEIRNLTSDTSSLKCPICDRNFEDFNLRNAHIKRKHQDCNKYHICECGNRFQRPSLLRKHIAITHHDWEEDKVKHWTPVLMRAPNKTKYVMSTTEKILQCELCGYTTKTTSSFDVHMRRHDGIKSFLCTHCGRGFVTKNSLENHEKIHSEERTFKCRICSQTFRQRQGRDIHERRHTRADAIKCNVCGFTFSCKANLKKHIEGIHQNNRPYPCPLCESRFKSTSSLKYHIKTHDNPTGRKRGINKDIDHMMAAKKRRGKDLDTSAKPLVLPVIPIVGLDSAESSQTQVQDSDIAQIDIDVEPPGQGIIISVEAGTKHVQHVPGRVVQQSILAYVSTMRVQSETLLGKDSDN